MIEILNTLENISLSEMDNVKLMNRIDTKYVMHISKLPLLLQAIEPYYRVLEIDNNRLMTYKNNYFDTADFKLYLAHHNGRVNRYKIRIREYVESQTVFTEIKFKDNKGKTRKKRTLTQKHSQEENNLFVKKHSPYYLSELENKLDIKFQRFTLVNKTKNERATIDVNLNFKKDQHECTLRKTVIVEIKQETYDSDSELIKALKVLKVNEQRISKYCIGTALINESIKKNNFKQKMMTIHKLEKN